MHTHFLPSHIKLFSTFPQVIRAPPCYDFYMYSDSFNKAIVNVLFNEGGYANNLSDPGGETNFGISKRAYPNLDIKHLTQQQAIDIYHRDYWMPLQADILPSQLAFNVFDNAVNMGLKTSIMMLQSVLGVTADGKIGPITRAAIIKCDPKLITEKFAIARVMKYATMTQFPLFGHTWISRTITTLGKSWG